MSILSNIRESEACPIAFPTTFMNLYLPAHSSRQGWIRFDNLVGERRQGRWYRRRQNKSMRWKGIRYISRLEYYRLDSKPDARESEKARLIASSQEPCQQTQHGH